MPDFFDMVNVGYEPNDGTGDPLRAAFIKLNQALWKERESRLEYQDQLDQQVGAIEDGLGGVRDDLGTLSDQIDVFLDGDLTGLIADIETSRAAAEAAAALAEALAQHAEMERQAAELAANASESARESADAARSQAEQAVVDALDAVNNAFLQSGLAANSADDAAGSASAASQAAGVAAQSAGVAAQAKDDADLAAAAAATSASAAAASAGAAGASATAAETSRLAAETARSEAESWSTGAATSADEAGQSAAEATAAAGLAATSASDAAGSANASATSASAAQTAADDASTSATASEGERIAAETAKAAAEIAATNAATSESGAEASASTASSAAIIAVEASHEAEVAVIAAETPPSIFSRGLRYWTTERTGDGTSEPQHSGLSFIGDDPMFGHAAHWESASNGANVLTRAPLPWGDGRIYRVTVSFNVLASSHADGQAGLALTTIGLDRNFASPSLMNSSIVTYAVDEEQSVSATFSDRPFKGVDFDGLSGSTWVRFGLRNARASQPLSVRIKTILVEDITAEVHALNSAEAAAESATIASASATTAGEQATIATTARLAAETAAGNASVSEAAAAVSESDARSAANSASTSAGVSASARDAAIGAAAGPDISPSFTIAAIEAVPEFGTATAGLPHEFNTSVASHASYGSDADGNYIEIDATTGHRYVRLRKLAAVTSDSVVEVVFRVKASVEMTLGLRPYFIDQSGADIRNWQITYAEGSFPANEVVEIRAVISQAANDLSTSTGGTVAEWNEIAGIRFGLKNNDTYPDETLRIYGVFVRDMTAPSMAGKAATAAATSAAFASTKATEAEQFANAAETSRMDAETQRAAAEVASGNAVSAQNAAGQHRADAQSYMEMAARVVGQGTDVLRDQFLGTDAGWTNYHTGPTWTPSTKFPLGRDATWDVTSLVNAGIETGHSAWVGPTNARAYVVEVDFTLNSGSIEGAGVVIQWINTSDGIFRGTFAFANNSVGEIVMGRMTTARAVLRRPSNFTGPFASNKVIALANYTGLGLTRAAKNITFHRISVRTATAEELGEGEVEATISQKYATTANLSTAVSQGISTYDASVAGGLSATVTQSATAVANLGGYLAATATLTAELSDTGQIAGIRATVHNGEGAAETGSLLELIGDNVLVEHSLTARSIDVGDLLADIAEIGQAFITDAHVSGKIRAHSMEIDGPLQLSGSGSMAAFKISPNDSTDGLYFGQSAGGFAFTASRTQGNIRQEIALTPKTFRLVNARHLVTGEAEVTRLPVGDTGGPVDLPAGINKIRFPVILGGGGGGASGGYNNWGSADPFRFEPGGDGGDTIVRLYDGSTLMHTFVGPGGAGGDGLSTRTDYVGDAGESTAYGPGGSASHNTPGANGYGVGLRGGGGGGGGGGSDTIDQTNKFQARRLAGGRGGNAAIPTSTDWIDVSKWANPRLEVIRGAGGAGGVVPPGIAPTRRFPSSGHYYVDDPAPTDQRSVWVDRARLEQPFGIRHRTHVRLEGRLLRDNVINTNFVTDNYTFGDLTVHRGGLEVEDVTSASIFERRYGVYAVASQVVGGKGGIGGGGLVEYEYTDAVDIPADVVPLIPTATGTIAKSGLNVTFPDLGAGMWTIWHVGTDNLDIGFVEVSPGNEIHIRIGGIFTFFSSQTPVRMSGGYSATRTIGYAFHKMGSWG